MLILVTVERFEIENICLQTIKHPEQLDRTAETLI